MEEKSIKQLKAASPVGAIFDFPEKFSPMLVKEIRQGLRSASYTGLFIAMQIILVIIFSFILYAKSLTTSDFGENVSGALFTIYAVTICILQPLRGMSAIHQEISRDTLDLVLLTRLSAWKIVYGKWVSLMGQSFLFTVSLFPYLIVRYFLGGMDLLEETTLFYLIFIMAGVVTAISVGLSAVPTLALRFIITGGLITSSSMLISTIAAAVISQDVFLGFFFSAEPWVILGVTSLVITIVASYLIWIFLDFGATMIAPISENRATLRRLLYIAISLFGCLCLYLVNEPTPPGHKGFGYREPVQFVIQMIMFGLFIPFFVTTVTERYFIVPKVCRQLHKNKFLKPVRYLFYPGWASGYAFLSLCILFHLGLMLTLEFPGLSSNEQDGFYLAIVIGIGSLVFPAAVTYLFGRRYHSPLTFYLIAFISSMLVTTLTMALSEIVDEKLALFFIWNPSSMIYLLSEKIISDTSAGITIGSLLIIVYSVIIFIRSKVAWAHLFQQEKSMKQADQKTRTSEMEQNNEA